MAGRDDYFVPESVELRIRTKTGDNKICVIGDRRNSKRRLWIWAGADAWRNDPPERFEPQRRSYATVEAAQSDASRIFPAREDLDRFIKHGFNGEAFRESEFSLPFIPPSWSAQLPAENTPPPLPELFDESRDVKKYQRPQRPNQDKFKSNVFKRYGAHCAFCRIDSAQLLDAAHIVAWSEMGADIPENGLALCKLHHRALDAGLIRIEPDTLALLFGDKVGPVDLHVEVADICSLPARPDARALRWLWKRTEAEPEDDEPA